jgi:poly-gamma-glutamate synthesis protein (capsule biosynthesis protein)
MAGLAAAPLMLLCGAKRTPAALTLTVTGQALIAHDLCADAYSGLAEVIAEIRRGDIAMTDLETAIRTDASGSATRKGVFLHAAGPEVLRCLRSFGFDMLALANNHAGDFGREGVLTTLQAVREAGFSAAGSGRDLAEASQAGRLLTNGQAIGLVAMAAGKIREGAAATAGLPGINELRLTVHDRPDGDDAQRIVAAIREAAHSARVVAYLHNHDWGDDMRVTRPWTRDFARACIDAGASAFFAHGAPLLHGIEMYRGAPIFYCLGSLIFHSRTTPGHYLPEVWESAIAHLHYRSSQLQQIELVPVVLNERGDDATRPNETRGHPRIATGMDAQRILHRLQARSEVFGTSLVIQRGRGWIAMD